MCIDGVVDGLGKPIATITVVAGDDVGVELTLHRRDVIKPFDLEEVTASVGHNPRASLNTGFSL